MNIALVGNPNVGKSTLFNALTGLRQHTGNWPGKTVDSAVGSYSYHGREYCVTDLPGLYSLHANSEEERLATEFIGRETMDCTIVVCDATCLARSLILALQVMRVAKRMVICLNLSDEAEKRGLKTDEDRLSRALSLPVVVTAAGKREGIEELKRTVQNVCDGFLVAEPCISCVEAGEKGAIDTAQLALTLAESVQGRETTDCTWRERLDRLLLHPAAGYPAAFLLLLLILWLTIRGANLPGQLLERLFSDLGILLSRWLSILPNGLRSFLVDGVYDTASRVVTVMLPPMAIFFPLFTLLEDLGFLPRLAFLLDAPFARCGSCGKQALTSCMSLGCNAVGVTGCRIIDSPRERLIAILTSSFLPCNGRFPTLLLLSSMLFSGRMSAFIIALCLVISMGAVMICAFFLSKTLLRGEPSGFVLELPPFRKPRVGEVVVRSILDRTLRILGRAVLVAAPAGGLIWLLSHIQLGEGNILRIISQFLDPLGAAMGLSGSILLAFVLGFPANELVLPVLVMLLSGSGTLGGTGNILHMLSGSIQPIPMMIFCLFHWPCAPTVMTIYKETGSLRWTLCGVLLPTVFGMVLCFLVQMIMG